jgi:hypothetical protein
MLLLNTSLAAKAENPDILSEFYTAYYNGNKDSCLNLLQSCLQNDSYTDEVAIRIMQYSVLSYQMDALEYEEFLYQLYPGTEDFENLDLLLWYCNQIHRYQDFSIINALLAPRYESIKSKKEEHPEQYLSF